MRVKTKLPIIIFIIFFLIIIGAILYFLSIKKSVDLNPNENNLGNNISSTSKTNKLKVLNGDTRTIPFTGKSNTKEIFKSRDDRILTQNDMQIILEEQELKKRRLVRLFIGPTAGYRIDKKNSGDWEVRVVEQGQGSRYIISVNPYSNTRVATGEITKVKSAEIFANGSVLLLYESESGESIVRSAFVQFIPNENNSQIQTFEDNIRVATNNKNLLFFTKKIGDSLTGLVVDINNPSNTKVVWESGFSSWIPRWGRNSLISIQTPTSKIARGYIYLLDPDGKLPTNRFLNLKSGGGAFIDTESGYFVLHSIEEDDFVGKTIITNQAGTEKINIPTTLPEKCDGFNAVFICAVPDSVPSETLSGYQTIFPDSWYQGDLTLSDSILLIDAETGKKEILLSSLQKDFKDLTENSAIDAINLKISDDGKLLFFINKLDGSLWVLRI